MPQQVITSVENNFTKGLITESTGLNFPENAATDADNCVFTLIGDVTRREGIDFEEGGDISVQIDVTNKGMSSYVWNNPGGDGNSKLLVKQVGSSIWCYNIGAASASSPLSQHFLANGITFSGYVAVGGVFDDTQECEYADGNGYLFVYHPSCDPFYVTFDPISKTYTSARILVQIRDFVGVLDNLSVSTRPGFLSIEHQYNLTNQGWVKGALWSATSSDVKTVAVGAVSFNVAAGLTVTIGDKVSITSTIAASPGGIFQPAGSNIMSGNVTGYAGTTLSLNITSVQSIWSGSLFSSWAFFPISTGLIDTFNTAVHVYPSNSDVWWTFKDSTGTFSPATTIANQTFDIGNAPKGHFVFEAFNQNRIYLLGLAGIPTINTTARPKTGCWFQGRVWYTGVNAQQAATADTNFTSWAENIYFSQVVVSPSDFGSCFQLNDPTSETLNGLLPTDGGVVTIAGCGSVYKLFPISNGLLVFANNGVWFITGSQGIGFSANDYTVTKISNVKILTSKAFIDVMGLPYFWNEDGIYRVSATQNNSLSVEPITVGTIQTFYNNIPTVSKRFARGDYNPIDYQIQWCFRSTEEASVTERYQFDSFLNYNVYNKAFYPYSIATPTTGVSINAFVHDVKYVTYPFTGQALPPSNFKYLSSYQLIGRGYFHGIAEEHDPTFFDWSTITPINYISTFTTGYKLHGKGLMKFQVPYIYTFSRNDTLTSFYIQGLWDYANDRDSNRWTVRQFIDNNDPKFGVTFRRHRLRGRGLVLQIKFTSVDQKPFDIIGWSVYENLNAGI